MLNVIINWYLVDRKSVSKNYFTLKVYSDTGVLCHVTGVLITRSDSSRNTLT